MAKPLHKFFYEYLIDNRSLKWSTSSRQELTVFLRPYQSSPNAVTDYPCGLIVCDHSLSGTVLWSVL